MKLYDLIPEGKESAISKVDLMKITGLSDRALRLMVSYERRRGKLILTDCAGSGYYRPTSEQDVIRFVRSMRRRARETNLIADAAEAALLNEVGQEQIGGWSG